MQRNITVLKIVVGLVFCLLVGLGTWQMFRLQEKENFIAHINYSINNPPTQYNPDDMRNHQYKAYNYLLIPGYFDSKESVFLYGRRAGHNEKDGYYLMSPFTTSDNQRFLVLRGWFPKSLKNDVQNAISRDKDAETTIKALLMEGAIRKFPIPENDLKNKIWFTIDLNDAAKSLDITNKDFYLMQVDEPNLPYKMTQISKNALLNVKNDHLEYALTWYILAIAIIIIYIKYKRDTNKNFV